MRCIRINAAGINAIVCTDGRRARCKCGNVATKECDWKVPARRSGTCDAKLCESCTHSPAPEKDLCQKHAKDWEAMKHTLKKAASDGR